MEYADGPSLSHHLGNNGRVEEATAMMIFKQLRDALGYAHEQGVIHRDIKPANAILTNGNGNFPQVKLIDFGLAKLSNIENPKLTINGEVIGSPLYMSPEQCKGIVVDNRSDIYSLGCLMHEVITGYPPFRGETALDTFRMHVQDEYEEPSANVCSEHLRGILRKCLRKRPEDRFSSLNDIVL
jgi:serine/threonine-protein kinase